MTAPFMEICAQVCLPMQVAHTVTASESVNNQLSMSRPHLWLSKWGLWFLAVVGALVGMLGLSTGLGLGRV